jgi:predicted metal-dependent hydrolase
MIQTLMLPLYVINYSYRKTIGIRIDRRWELCVSAPIGASKEKVDNFVQSKRKRIMDKITLIKKEISDWNTIITKEMKEHALIQILPRIEYYADLMDIQHRYTNIRISTAHTKRWSCNSRWWLMFHRKLSQFPISIVDYIVVHELAHLIHFNHSKNFWNLVESYYPGYKTAKRRLKENTKWISIG